ncbi:cell wall-binding repeat-containing protein [Herbiconiux liangxiaofengii]|uniref:cell wall-binding repeat-containing protein n=1 Tax=Herbiconiux liangxiaofengii TaxID=3342795 RepID=UPI0035B76E2A
MNTWRTTISGGIAVLTITAVLAIGAAPATAGSIAESPVSVTGPSVGKIVEATVDSQPFYYAAGEDYFPRAHAAHAEIDRLTPSIRFELSDRFATGASGTVDWSVAGADELSGSVTLNAASQSVSIPLTADFYDLATETPLGPSTVILTLKSHKDAPEGLSSQPLRFSAHMNSGWSSVAQYRIGLRSPAKPPLEPAAQLVVGADAYVDLANSLDRGYWATVPETAVIDSTTSLQFQADTVLWDRDQEAPIVRVEKPWLDETWQQGSSASLGSPEFSSDKSSVTITSQLWGDALTPFIDGKGLAQISAGTTTAMGGGTTVTTVAPVGTTTSIPTVSTTRLSGGDRYSGGLIDSIAAFPNRPRTVYLASGTVFADALSAGPAAVRHGAPLLLVQPHNYLLSEYLEWLEPEEIVIMGGPATLPDDVVQDLLSQSRLDPASYHLRRDAGPDRYSASLAISAAEFADGADTAFLATGATFADALTAIPAAAHDGSPVILVAGERSNLDSATLAELRRLGVSKVVIAGGPASVSPGIETQLEGLYPGSVVRFGGATRFEVAESMNATYFPEATTAYIATGANFPDALTGGVLAGVNNAPLLLSQAECIPTVTWDRISLWKPGKVTLLGGVNSLGAQLKTLPRCS